MNLFDVTIWDGSRLLHTAENIVAANDKQAVPAALRAIASRSRNRMQHAEILRSLNDHLTKGRPAPDGVRVFVAQKQRGKQVI